VPDGGGELKLLQRGSEFSIRSGNTVLMNSRMSGSEIALADAACDRLKNVESARILIGGYGMGFTLRAALARLGSKSHVVVAELVPAVIAWARGPMAELTRGCLDDARVEVHLGDVGQRIATSWGAFDAILLDVDNGPDALSRAANERLYDGKGLALAKRALRPGGLLAVWSAAPDRGFTRRLEHAGFAVEILEARAHKGRGLRSTIWIARHGG